jgi:xanthine dehydrogenase molybdopterin-binding subunit B
VTTHKDVPSLTHGISPVLWDENLFCTDILRYLGDKVAVAAFIDDETCFKGLAIVRVEHEPRCQRSRTSYTPWTRTRLMCRRTTYSTSIRRSTSNSETRRGPSPRPITCERTPSSVGDPTMRRGSPMLPAPSRTDSPHSFQSYTARQFGLPMSAAQVVKPYLGGGFGGRFDSTGLEFAGPCSRGFPLTRANGLPQGRDVRHQSGSTHPFIAGRRVCAALQAAGSSGGFFCGN